MKTTGIYTARTIGNTNRGGGTYTEKLDCPPKYNPNPYNT